MIFSVITACFGFLEDIFKALASIEVIDGVSFFNVCLSFIIISTVIFGLLSTVKTVSGRSVGVRYRHKREREYRERRISNQ